jgi:hypothetical protein
VEHRQRRHASSRRFSVLNIITPHTASEAIISISMPLKPPSRLPAMAPASIMPRVAKGSNSLRPLRAESTPAPVSISR